jgi:hypothetical protein
VFYSHHLPIPQYAFDSFYHIDDNPLLCVSCHYLKTYITTFFPLLVVEGTKVGWLELGYFPFVSVKTWLPRQGSHLAPDLTRRQCKIYQNKEIRALGVSAYAHSGIVLFVVKHLAHN